MNELWQSCWDARVEQTGRPDRVVETLTDVELVELLRSETDGQRRRERVWLGDELLRRLHEEH